MEDITVAGNIVNPESVISWWRWKLETRKSVPPCATASFEVRESADYNFGWNTILPHDYLYLSYTCFCENKDLCELNEIEFHEVFLCLFTGQYEPDVIREKCHGFRQYIDDAPVRNTEYVEIKCYHIPSIYLCRALFEIVTDSEPIDWSDGCRMKKSYKGSRKFWDELRQKKFYRDNAPEYGDQEFLPWYIERRLKQ